MLAPVTAIASIDLQCHVLDVDYAASCTSGSVQIGHLDRMALLIGLVVGSHAICYVVVSCCVQFRPSTAASSLFLTSGATFLFTQSPWMYKNVYYVDRASAALNGLLTLRWGQKLVVLDIKIWRAFVVSTETMLRDTPPPLQAALPLVVQ
ncbi:hypothetical protein SDRG_08049 [Saprolegnia diclina VS20]|nr:hypothetical protein SDRG_08049 [Saprolegnia diclina VS20]EQC34276.1 hypothetical protein SDRG_08049 [Saprolegnia diclina VS20]|eukprot:XP_008612138.1 hypothetical protein SDRG_08049 [Saprolegnia diclina VS20]